jgi:hypothetical protein
MILMHAIWYCVNWRLLMCAIFMFDSCRVLRNIASVLWQVF